MIDTYSSFIAGYTVCAAIIVAYVITLAVRARRLREKLRSSRSV